MKILYLVPYSPTPIRTRPYHLIRYLARQGHEVTLATVWENEQERQNLDDLAQSGIDVIAEPLVKTRRLVNIAGAFLKKEPLQFRYSWQPGLANILASRLRNNQSYCDIIHIEHLRGAIYGQYIQSTLGNSQYPPIVWDSVDNISLLFEQAIQRSKSPFGRWITHLELPRTRKCEGYLATQFNHTLVTSPLDQEAFSRLMDKQAPAKVDVLTNGVDLEFFSPSTEPRQPNTVVFSGKLSYHANLTAAIYLVEEVMPLVWEKRSNVKVQLVGKDPPKVIQSLTESDPRIEVTGTVADIRPYLRQATLAAATITYGVGVQNKVLEAMSCATPVVATPQAVSALDAEIDRDILVGTSPQEIAGAILRLIEEPSFNRLIGTNGREYVTRRHNWSDIASQLVTIYENIIRASSIS